MDDLEIPVFLDQIAKQIHEMEAAGLERIRLAPSFAAYRCAQVAKRNAGKLKATPGWADLKEIEQVYELAALRTKALGIKHVVDHIIPLQNKRVCGLHCEQNLRVITAFENSKKKNKHSYDGWLRFPQLAPTIRGRSYNLSLSDYVETRPLMGLFYF